MSMKRAASRLIDHENWDKEDPSDKEVIGSFKPAPREVLEKRVMRTARRRTQVSNDDRKKGAFSGFGFNKTQPSSFDFLANLTSQPNINSENAALMTSKPINSSMFNTPISSGSPFGNTGASTNPAPSLFQMPPKNDNPSSGLFGAKPIGANVFASPAPAANNVVNFGSPPQAVSPLFKMSSNNTSTPSSSLFGNKPPSSNASPVNFGTFGSTATSNATSFGASVKPLFEMPSNNVSTTSAGLFGNKPTNLFGAATSQSDNADKTATPPKSSLFQMPSNGENTSGLFGNKTTPTGMFGSPTLGSNNITKTDTPPKSSASLFQMPNTEKSPSSGIFGNKLTSNSIFSLSSSSDSTAKTDTSTKTTSTLFQMPQNNEKTSSSGLFGNKTTPSVPFGLTSSKNEDKIDSPPKIGTSIFTKPTSDEKKTSSDLFRGKSTGGSGGLFGLPASSNNNFANNAPKSETTSSLFRVPASKTVSPSIFAVSESSDAFKQQSSSKSDSVKRLSEESQTFESAKRSRPSNEVSTSNQKNSDENTTQLHSRLKALNTAVLKWITLHVDKSPTCVLSPIFVDYDNHVKSIREKYDEDYEHYKGKSESGSIFSKSENKPSGNNNLETKKPVITETITKESSTNEVKTQFTFGIKNPQPSTGATNASSIFGEYAKPPTGTPQTFTFGIKPSTPSETNKEDTMNAKPTTGTPQNFTFGIKPSTPSETNKEDTMNAKPTTGTPQTFTFGIKPSSPSEANKEGTINVKPTTGTPQTFTFGIKTSTTSEANKDDTITTSSSLTSTEVSKSDASRINDCGSKAETVGSASSVTLSVSNTSTTADTTTSISTTTTTFYSTPKTSSPINKVEPFGVEKVATTTNKGSLFSFNTSGSSPFSSLSNKSPFSTTTGSPFSSTNTLSTSSAPFSFGVGKPFSFSSNVVQKSDDGENAEENEEPPKVEYTPVKEDNSVFEKKCKVFIKKEDNYVDKGVGTLYIKKVENSEKHQLLVRANTNLGTVLVNLILASAIPTQRMGKNNVMLVCIPTPDSKPPPTPILIRVKTSTEADELLETLNKYKA